MVGGGGGRGRGFSSYPFQVNSITYGGNVHFNKKKVFDKYMNYSTLYDNILYYNGTYHEELQQSPKKQVECGWISQV